ncbi:pseudaminic acid cytidylyltransferase [Kingella negevensis]|uniref:CMP-N,N'-diacetyllegionaminic acid synthase n=1 Tax=Kingella negevensis TaxID=1522312 RepID=A0A238HI83_9NEIS|nr:pseudaminic acid cytidylyltransferase [Kingella negevensis]MDK4679998.1 pseudaminic acid cytidylyltransferase [Kingella negevensis]MDK4682282.1 pseudaminic acid cytidylyltransferase [Kingella negevensis]MDK4684850.1 pseudaminic acid cytidylyltransferase [Kingella negevensis]MDK4688306.1 pseudaminic acid cytidylyltransferase [Kingella negevensis]MDK4690479.1 pseudaminic acid cytidylyltransferase [Kingella negevensis]
MTLCIIPARGGSKRIPRKNIKLFNGKPMIAHSIQAAQDSGCFEQIIVSTDDAEIADISQQYGATVPFTRPAELSDDFATTGAVIAHAFDFMQQHGWQGDSACCLYATAPFVQANDLQSGLLALRDNQADFAFSVTSFPFPIQRALKLAENGTVSMFQPDLFAVRSQDLPEAWHDAGQFYWGTAAAWLAQKPIFNSHSVACVVPRYRVQDIDTLEDWTRAEMMWRVLAELGE